MTKKGGIGRIMNDIKNVAKQAKSRLKTNFWQKCKDDIDKGTLQAKTLGLNENKVKDSLKMKVKSVISGEKQDEFYLKVKKILDEEGEVYDIIGRLTDKQYYATLNYEEKQRYTLELSGKYLRALEKYKKESLLSVKI